MSTWEALGVIFLVAAVTLATRALPVLLVPGKKKQPAFILYLGKYLPPAMIALLVVYCLKGAGFTAFPFALPELLSVAAVAGLHLWKKNTMLSIGGGTILYMVLVQFVFPG